ncbi:hypothetical protein OY671_010464 [Metschnikowia pulcherrima]|nr:hypothetical protein OY671_010464 [Metschnikowia pulcherrima]
MLFAHQKKNRGTAIANAALTTRGPRKLLQPGRDKVQISGSLDLKGLDASEKNIAALRISSDTYIEANDTGEE